MVEKDIDMKHDRRRTSTVPTNPQRKTTLERSARNMKLIIAGLSVALAACVVYIVTLPAAPSSDPSGMTGGYPPAAQQPMPASAPQETGTTPEGQATPQQVPSSTVPATADPTPTPATTDAAPAGQKTGKINPPHGQPGHRCDIPVGSALP